MSAQPQPLREVRGPSALGGGVRRFFDLLWLMAGTEFKRVYFGTFLGYLWSLIRPLAFFGVLLFVFTRIFKLGAGLHNYPVLLLLGIVQYTFFQEATTNAVTSVVAQEGIVRKTQFPRLVIPLSTVLTAFFNFCLNLIVVFAFLLAWGVEPAWTWLLYPVALAALFILTIAMSMAFSVLYVRFRDVAIIWAVGAQMLFYAAPILYPLGKEGLNDPAMEKLLMINPLSVIFEQARVWVLHEPAELAPTPATAAGGWVHLLPAAVIYVAICVFGVWVFNREAPRVAEEL
ncbi:MAG TPA: ABC transporter permease [Solirubrobacterales bacterium]|jgi:ABC-2 type transport system permease protein|nr:ABC transporter permease [Solirubrobacterales bacterium]